MKAKVYERSDRPGVWFVQLYWKGRRYRRGHYDAHITQMNNRMAWRIAEAINADIEDKGPGFDPRLWFKLADNEFRFDLYAEKWIRRNIHKYAPSVAGTNERYIKYAIEFFGERDLRAIKLAMLKDFVEWLPTKFSGPPSSKTLKNAFDPIKKILHDAFDEELIPKLGPWPKFETVEPDTKWITREWQDKIINAIPEHDRPIFLFMKTWGVRPGEARALQWDCVDFDGETICIKRTFSGVYLREHTKTRRIRYLPFTDELRDMFNSIRGIGGFVFRSRSGRPYPPHIWRKWNKARDRVGAPKVTLYEGTRHSFATQHPDKLSLVQQVFGHTNSNMTNRYRKLNLAKIKEMVE